MRADALQHQGQLDPVAYEGSVKLANEVATVLRKNFVQAQRVTSDNDERWSKRALFFVVPNRHSFQKSELPSTPNSEVTTPSRILLQCHLVARADGLSAYTRPLVSFVPDTYLNRCCSE